MMKLMLGLHLLALFILQGCRAAPAEGSSESSYQPHILSQPDEIVADVGTEVSLPCIAEDLRGRQLIWRKNEKILSIGNQTVDKFGTKYHIKGNLNGNILVISNVDKLDEATFTCCISSESTNKVDHQLRINPSIDESKTAMIEKEKLSKGKVYFARVPSFYTLPNRVSSQETEKNDKLRKHDPKSVAEFIKLINLYGKNVLKKKEAEEFKEFMLEKLPIPNKKLLRSTHQYATDIRQTLGSAQLGKIYENNVSKNKVGSSFDYLDQSDEDEDLSGEETELYIDSIADDVSDSNTHSNSFENQNQITNDLDAQKKQMSSVKNEEKSSGYESKNDKDLSVEKSELHIDSVADDVSDSTDVRANPETLEDKNQITKDLEKQEKQISSIENQEETSAFELKTNQESTLDDYTMVKEERSNIDDSAEKRFREKGQSDELTKQNGEEEGSGILESEVLKTKTSEMSDKFYGQGNIRPKEYQPHIPLEKIPFDQSKSVEQVSMSNYFHSFRYLPQSPLTNESQDNQKDFEYIQRKGNSLRGQHLPQENLKDMKILHEVLNKQEGDDGDTIDDKSRNQLHFEDAHTSTEVIDETQKQLKEILVQSESKKIGSHEHIQRNNEDRTTTSEVISDFWETPKYTREDDSINESIGEEKESRFSEDSSNKEVENESSDVGKKEGHQNTNFDGYSKKSDHQHYTSNVDISGKAFNRDLDINKNAEEEKIKETNFPAPLSAFRYLQEKNLEQSEVDSKPETSKQSATLRGQHSFNVVLGDLSNTDENNLSIKNKVIGDMGNSNNPSLDDGEKEEKTNEKTDINVVDESKYKDEKIDLSNEEDGKIENEKLYPKEIKDIERHFFKKNFEFEGKMKAPQRIPHQQKRRQEAMIENTAVQEQKKEVKSRHPILVLQGKIDDSSDNREGHTLQEETSLSPLASARASKQEFLSSNRHPMHMQHPDINQAANSGTKEKVQRIFWNIKEEKQSSKAPNGDGSNRRKYSNEPHPFRSICWGMHC